MFQKMPVILIVIILTIVLLDSFIPLEVKQFLYATSLLIKSIIIFLLPFIIFSLLFKVALSLASNATRVVLIIICAVCLSNFLSTFLAHFVGEWIYTFDLTLVEPTAGSKTLEPSWLLALPSLVANDKAMIAGLGLGIILGMFKPHWGGKMIPHLENGVAFILKLFIYMIPIFVAGFIIKLQYDGVMGIIIRDYALIFIVVALAQYTYLAFLYFAAANFKFQRFLSNIKNMLPALIGGFSTMSSASVMPLTILGTEKNAENVNTARSIIPATSNVQMVGDCFAITIFAYALLKNYGMDDPTFLQYLGYAFFYVIAMFSTAGVPGGTVLVMLPILEEHFGFNSDMLSLITALYILLDPVITSANVMGNGAFALLLEKVKFIKNALSSSEKPQTT